MCFNQLNNEHLPRIGHCARVVDLKDLTKADFRCELRVIRVIESFRGAVKSSVHHAWVKPMKRYTRKNTAYGKPRYHFYC